MLKSEEIQKRKKIRACKKETLVAGGGTSQSSRAKAFDPSRAYPFNDSEHASLFAKISRGQFTVPECLSSKARCMIRALLRRDPEERIASEDVLYHPWLLHDDSKDHAYGLHSGSRTSNSSAALDDHCVPEWYDPSDGGASSSSRMHYSTSGDAFDN
uniref:Protein kinase domain-containing protein n=1 Tax=Anopheles maculatus TaxID=74869 RepID=A0A182S7K2_9DIPT